MRDWSRWADRLLALVQHRQWRSLWRQPGTAVLSKLQYTSVGFVLRVRSYLLAGAGTYPVGHTANDGGSQRRGHGASGLRAHSP